jgi:GDPmannose 4,6-dehydratase
VREFLQEAFGYVNLDWQEYVEIDPRYFRPTEVDYLLADPTKARKSLEWEPRVFFPDLVRVMVDADLEMQGLKSPGSGRRILEAHHGKWHRWEDQVKSDQHIF